MDKVPEDYINKLCLAKGYFGKQKEEFALKEICKWIDRIERENSYWAINESLRFCKNSEIL